MHSNDPSVRLPLASRTSGFMRRLSRSLRAGATHVFNLNDPRWGRQDDETPPAQPDRDVPPPAQEPRPSASRPGSQPGRQDAGAAPDLDELWRDFNRKIGRLLGNRQGGGEGQPPGAGQGGGRIPDGKGAGLGIGAIATGALVLWLLSGFFIVQEGQQAVVTRFGQYRTTVGAGINWTLPYPIERHETVNVTQIRSVDIGSDGIVKSTGLRDSAMLTADENIVEIKFAVQYRLSNARDYLFASRDPQQAVVQAAETAIREVIGGMRMDAALAEERDQIGPRVRKLMQAILDRYQIGIDVVGVNLQQGGVRPPEQVQAAFDDVLKAGQERERAKNEAQAYAMRVVPMATGTAARLKSEADAYKAKVVAQAQGDAERFNAILPEYRRAPQATRDRMYIDTMKQVYSSVTKILVETRQGSMLYLPLDKILQNTSATAGAAKPAASDTGATSTGAASSAGAGTQSPGSAAQAATGGSNDPVADARSRDPDVARSRNQ